MEYENFGSLQFPVIANTFKNLFTWMFKRAERTGPNKAENVSQQWIFYRAFMGDIFKLNRSSIADPFGLNDCQEKHSDVSGRTFTTVKLH